jgi:hypothetical protein
MLEKAKALDAEAGLQRPITYHVGKAVWFQNNPFILLFFHSLASLSLSLSLYERTKARQSAARSCLKNSFRNRPGCRLLRLIAYSLGSAGTGSSITLR